MQAEVGLHPHQVASNEPEVKMGDLKRVVQLLEIATRDEREACAKICDDEADAKARDGEDWGGSYLHEMRALEIAIRHVARMIRARGGP